MRKLWLIPVFLCMALGVFLIGYLRPWLSPNTFVSGWGAISKDQQYLNATQPIQFNATIKNKGHYPVYVKEVKAIFAEAVNNNFQSGDTTIAVGKWLKPNETSEVEGKWLFSTSGIKNNNIMQAVPTFVSFQVRIFP
ncbi:hypothetical protein [Paenibacillus glycanilyticus]|uniref:DUF3426 domain-containing protein n=1 Tax=Paenibacillus glycanilyticus TaxID=126569 RepID=A0ABQ6GEX2_9BACL|nr:hypothetical protein [Paenibacillus glycanilyticus]GLX69418.1 hypothetical protein MU1_37630 [Paenibacillus glycanilyticus]